jgi:hypothetical protein
MRLTAMFDRLTSSRYAAVTFARHSSKLIGRHRVAQKAKHGLASLKLVNDKRLAASLHASLLT